MSFHNAIVQRQTVIANYKTMLETETDPVRIADIKSQIGKVSDTIGELKKKQIQIFGKKSALIQETKIIEPDPEQRGGQKVTVLNPLPKPIVPQVSPELTTATTAPSKRMGNALRTAFKSKVAETTENSLKAQIAAAKAAKK